jgi:hypothetical protein
LSFVTNVSGQDCGTVFDLENLRRTNHAAYKEYVRIEKFTNEYRKKQLNNPNPDARLIDENGIITIPIVFHVLHRGEALGVGTNLSDNQLIGQVAIINQCFSQTNDQVPIPAVFRNVAGNPNIRFEIACTDPNGNGTNGIVRRASAANFTSGADNIKNFAQGGDNAWPVDRFLNIWIAPNLEVGLFGYAQKVEFLSSNPNTDGVVVRFDAVGINAANNFAGRNGGRTMVHEIGHWINLIHLFDNGCSNDDGCLDTPPQANRTPETVVCPIAFPRNASICSIAPNGDMYDNFMDGTNEACGRRMFTNDQVIRMRAMFQLGGPRRSFVNNLFKIAQAYPSCGGTYVVRSPYCAANGNVQWTITGPATVNGNSSAFTACYVTPQSGANGVATLTATWNNLADDVTFPIGYGAESSSYNFYYPFYSYNQLRVNGVHTTAYNSTTYGQVSFTGATGQAQNWQLLTSSSQAVFSGNGNNFSIRLTQPYAFATIRATIPTICGTRTVDYSFYGGYGMSYAISPNPTSSNITITATSLSGDPNARAGSSTADYEVQIFNNLNQLLKKTKNVQGGSDITVDVSSFPPNQFYTVKLISSTDVQTKTFFKQ